MVAVSLALFIFDEIMRPSVTTYVSEGPRITLRYMFAGLSMATVVSDLSTVETNCNCKIEYLKQSYAQP